MPALDAYDDADLDEDVDDPELAPDARAAAERAMARRDVREGRAGRRGARLPGALQGARVKRGAQLDCWGGLSLTWGRNGQRGRDTGRSPLAS
jgi:hypothetical protein